MATGVYQFTGIGGFGATAVLDAACGDAALVRHIEPLEKLNDLPWLAPTRGGQELPANLKSASRIFAGFVRASDGALTIFGQAAPPMLRILLSNGKEVHCPLCGHVPDNLAQMCDRENAVPVALFLVAIGIHGLMAVGDSRPEDWPRFAVSSAFVVFDGRVVSTHVARPCLPDGRFGPPCVDQWLLEGVKGNDPASGVLIRLVGQLQEKWS